MKEQVSESKARLMTITAMTIYGTIGIFRRYIPLPSSVLAMVRGIVGTIFLLIVILAGHQKMSREAIRKNLFLLILSGALIGFNWILLFESYAYTTVAVATLCYYMAPVAVTMVSPLVLKEHLSFGKCICIFVALGGMAMVAGIFKPGGIAGSGAKGILLGLGAAALYASVILINKLLSPIGAYEKTIIQLASAAIVVFPYCLATGALSGMELNTTAVIMVLIVGVLHTGVAYALYFGSMDHLSAQTIAIFSYLDPVVAILLSALVLKEAMGPLEMLGAVLILGSTLVSELFVKE